jgi:peptidoglycan hydrolase-like protein with peptidoglycan-binding domain
MGKRLQKQLIISAIFLAIFLSIGGGIYLTVRSEATCFDNKRNQRETGVDCDGPCIPCDLKNNPPITVQKQPIFFLVQDKKINIFFQLLNSDAEWGAKSFSYQLTLNGQNGENQKLNFSDFILPQEIKYVLLPQVEVDFVPQSITITIDPKTIIWSKPIEGINLKLGGLFMLTGVKILEPETSVNIYKNVYTFTKTLRFGMKDPEVYNLQKVLSQTPSIYPEGQVTGYFGKATEAAVKSFQKKYGIRITGEVGPQTRAKLNELYGPKEQQPFSYTFDTKKVLKRNMQGIDIINLQQALALDSGYGPIGMVSGTFDKATEDAVKEFQKKYDLPVTGQVDLLTATKLNELFSQPSGDSSQLTQGTFEPYEATLKVEGNIYNSTPFSWKKGEIGVVLCDENKNPVTIGTASLENIISGKTTPFTIIWHYDLPKNLIVCEKEVHVNVLDIDNALVK